MSDLTVKYQDHAYYVLDGGEVVSGPHCQARALESQERLERQANMRERPCMCCRTVFMSEGSHNRLCAPCRRLGGNASWIG